MGQQKKALEHFDKANEYMRHLGELLAAKNIFEDYVAQLDETAWLIFKEVQATACAAKEPNDGEN